MQKGRKHKAIAWIQVGEGSPSPYLCEVEIVARRKYLVVKLKENGQRVRKQIEPKLLVKLLPDQWEGAEFIYRPLVKFGNQN